MARLLRSRSIVAAAVAAVVMVAAVALSAAGATSPPDLPPVPADRLIASALAAVADPSLSVSGTAQTHVDLGLPQLPGLASGPSGLADVLLADQTFKVWRSPDGVRIAQILPTAERDVVLTPTDAWLWDSDRFESWHAALPGASMDHGAPSLGDVEALVSNLLSRLTPYAEVTTAPPVEVAGRPAYVVRLAPTTPETLVDRVEVAIDAETRVPVRLEVFAAAADAAVVRIGYTAVSFSPVDPSVFEFTPPAGAPVHELQPPADGERGAPSEVPRVRCFGAGFDLVVAVSVPSVPKQLAPFFPYRGPIGSADVVERDDHAWIVAGLVPPDALAKVEPKLP